MLPTVKKSKQDRAPHAPAATLLTSPALAWPAVGNPISCHGQDPEGQAQRTHCSPTRQAARLAGFPRLYKVLIKYCKMLVQNRWLPSAVLKLNIWKENNLALLL